MTTMREQLQSSFENTEAMQVVVDVLVAEASKPINKRLADKVEAALISKIGPADYDVRLLRAFGMTSIEWGGYTRSQGNRGRSILIAHSEKSIPIGERYLADMKRYLSAAEDRNEQRKQLLRTRTPEEIDEARQQIVDALRKIQGLHDTGENYVLLPSAGSMLRELEKEF